MKLLSGASWPDYELVDSGGFEKLERFGSWLLWRPEPQAAWRKTLPAVEWEKLHHARFFRSRGDQASDSGNWVLKTGMPEQWFIDYKYQNLSFRMRLGLTSFKHVGVFPEQAPNWDYIYNNSINDGSVGKKKILNLFAYTGAASLAASAAGATVVHVDAVKPVISWARQNMEVSGLDGIRWVVEDALKFVRREANRGNLYDGIVLDPPAYGRGPDGEKWILEDGIGEMLGFCAQILKTTEAFVVLNLYSMGFSAVIAANLLSDYFGVNKGIEYGELVVADRSRRVLPLSVFARCRR